MKKNELIRRVAEMDQDGMVMVRVEGETGRDLVERVEIDSYGNLVVVIKDSGIPAHHRAKVKLEIQEALSV